MTELVDHLMRLGLSEYEARAYIAAVALGEGTVKEISVESGVPRSRAYDVLESLAERGFVQLGNSNPICYRANDPLVASGHLMDEIRRSNEKVIYELSEIGKRAEKAQNPIWTLMGDWAIDHKLTELISAAGRSILLVCFNNGIILRYAKLLTERSTAVDVTAVLVNEPESFAGFLGATRILRMNSLAPNMVEMDGEIMERGFVTKDGRYCIELIMLVDEDTSFILSKEKGIGRAIIIAGTIGSLFIRETLDRIVNSSEEAVAARRPGCRLDQSTKGGRNGLKTNHRGQK